MFVVGHSNTVMFEFKIKKRSLTIKDAGSYTITNLRDFRKKKERLIFILSFKNNAI